MYMFVRHIYIYIRIDCLDFTVTGGSGHCVGTSVVGTREFFSSIFLKGTWGHQRNQESCAFFLG